MHVNKVQMKLAFNFIIFLLIYINEVSNEAKNILPSKSLDAVHFIGKNLQISIIKDHKNDVKSTSIIIIFNIYSTLLFQESPSGAHAINMIQFEMEMAFHENVTKQPGGYDWDDNVKAASSKILDIPTRDIELIIEERKPNDIELRKKSTTTNILNYTAEFKIHSLDLVTTNQVLTIINSTSFTSGLRQQFLEDDMLRDYLRKLTLSIPPNVTRIAGMSF